jgi:hypothetical protein
MAVDYDTLAAIAIAGGVRHPALYEEVCDYVLGQQISAADPVHHIIQGAEDVNGVGVAFIAGGAVTPYDLEQIGNIVLTYPYTRAANDVLDVPTS